jgi:hypothetical protein
MDIDEVKITIIATGFEDKNTIAEPTIKKQESLLGTGATSINLENKWTKKTLL